MSLSLISYFICSKASNQSDLMQHNVHAAIFHLAQYSVCSIRQRRRRGFRCAARHSAACFFTQARCRQHTKICITHGNTVCVRRVFRVSGEMFQWRKSSDCCFGALICICSARRRQFNARRRQFLARRRQFYARLRLFHSRRTRRRLLCLCHNRWQQ